MSRSAPARPLGAQDCTECWTRWLRSRQGGCRVGSCESTQWCSPTASMVLVRSMGLIGNEISNSTYRTSVIPDHPAPSQILSFWASKWPSQNHGDEGRGGCGWLRALAFTDQARNSDDNVVVLNCSHRNGPFGRTTWHRASPSDQLRRTRCRFRELHPSNCRGLPL